MATQDGYADAELLREVEALLDAQRPDPAAITEALRRLHNAYLEHDKRLVRLVAISDTSQRLLQDEILAMRGETRRKNRREVKLSRISDLYQGFMLEQNQKLNQAATHDPLTGLPNRRLMAERLGDECQRARRTDSSFAVVMLDLDYFKSINDHYGHETGDAVLIAVAQCMTAFMRDYDVCGRWGGEEFLLLLTDIGQEEATDIVERLREAIAELGVPDYPEVVTASAGVAVHESDEEPENTVKRADRVLYQAKQTGRNRVVTDDLGARLPETRE